MPNYIGREIGGFKVVERIGAGGMATVYKAYQPAFDRYVAMKILPDHLAQDESFVLRFKQEARIIAKLEHHNILPVYSFGDHDGITYLVMRYLEAGTLKELITDAPEGTLTLSNTARIIGQIASALDYAHRQGIVHRDIKPANVLVDAQGDTYLTDFGIAKILEATTHLTATGTTLGTPAYMAPEQGSGGPIDSRSDIYSLGVILYEMVTGKLPFEADTPFAIMIAHVNDPLPLPSTIKPDIPEVIERVILKALAKDPAHRYQTGVEMVEALEKTRLVLEQEKTDRVEIATDIETISVDEDDFPTVERTIEDQAVTVKPVSKRKIPRFVPWVIGSVVIVALAVVGYIAFKPDEVLPSPTIAGSVHEFTPDATEIAFAEMAQATLEMEMTLTMGANISSAETQAAVERDLTLTQAVSTSTRTAPPPTVTPTPSLGIGSTMINSHDGMQMVYVPAGEFIMGDDNARNENAQPAHSVFLDAFWIYQTEVTNEMYALFLNEEGNISTDGIHWRLEEYYGVGDYAEFFEVMDGHEGHPVLGVTWYGADEYCSWAGGRLPTEAEFEKAARGTDGRLFPWGNEYDCSSFNALRCQNGSMPVGSYPLGASPYGAYDMIGNAIEWLADWYDSNYYAYSPAENPQGPESGRYRALRGTGWDNTAVWASYIYYRRWKPPNGSHFVDTGFRCVVAP